MADFGSVKKIGLFGVVLNRCGLQNVKKRFHVISIAKTWFFRFFRCKIIDFQILVASSRCQQNRKNLKIEILPQKYRECSGDAFFFFRKMFWTLESVFLTIFRQPLGAFWRKNKKFYVFLMFLDDFTRSQLRSEDRREGKEFRYRVAPYN